MASGFSFALSVWSLPLLIVGQKQWLNTSCYGIWDRDGRFSVKDRPFLKGTTGSFKWSDIEPTEGNVNLSLVNDSIRKAAAMGLCWYGMVHVGPDSPQWIYGIVPKVAVEGDTKHEFEYPFYLDASYTNKWYRMVRTVATFIRGLPESIAPTVGFFQVTAGCTGDEVAYKKAPLLAQYAISDAQWDVFRLEAFKKVREYFQLGSDRPVPLLFNEVDPEDHPTITPWLMENITSGLGIKGSAYVRGHHLSEEKTWIERWRSYMVKPANGVPLIFTRAEMDQTYSNPLYQINIKLGIYWGILNGLNQGLAVHDVSLAPMQNCYSWDIADSYVFFSRYAGEIFPETATNAFIALHEGLEGTDIAKFPEATYGQAIRNNGNVIKSMERLVAMCKRYESFGCVMGDLPASVLGQVYQRESQMAYNDAGWNIWPGNYQRFLEQIDAETTSQGWFRIGGPITSTSSKYARFGRGLNHAADKTGMYFKLVDGFFATIPVGPLSFHVIWYDKLPGSWQLEYTNTKGEKKTGFNQVSVGDGAWKHSIFAISDAAMARTHTRGSDFGISSSQGTDLIFHMIEIERGLSPSFGSFSSSSSPATPTPTLANGTYLGSSIDNMAIISRAGSSCSIAYIVLVTSILASL